MAYKRISPMPVVEGGTGDITLTNHGLLVGAGTSPVTQLAVGANGTVLIGNTGADPSFSASPTVSSITIIDPPVNPTDGTNKMYVDSIASGFKFFAPCVAATTANLTATYNNGTAGVGATLTNSGVDAAFSIDGQSPSMGQRVLIKNQSTQAQNGIYTVTTVGDGVTPWVLTRSTDYDTAAQIAPGDLVPVTAGTVNANTLWVQLETVVTMGTDPIVFSPFQSQGITVLAADTGSATGGTVTLAGGNNISTSGTSSTITINVADTTQHAVQVGSSAGALTSLSVGTTGQVLIGATGADPAFAALGVNSGLTAHGVLVGEGNSAIVALAVGTTGQVLIGATGANPAFGALGVNSGLVAHGVVISENNSAFAAATPSATSGIPLISQGSSSDPVFGTAVVAGGGTGDTSFTAYAVICGGTTSTGALQNVSGVGTSGQVLTSNGASALPSWQAGGGGGGGITWVDVTGTSQTMSVNMGYSANNAGLVTITLPSIAAFGSIVAVVGNGAGGWLIAQNSGQTIHFNSANTTTGVSGSLASTVQYNAVELLCTVANTDWVVRSSEGNITIV